LETDLGAVLKINGGLRGGIGFAGWLGLFCRRFFFLVDDMECGLVAAGVFALAVHE
jgi:hypothetical protein